jgi:hypothetical protein
MINNKGGKVLASGGYGCVFTPALKCKEQPKRDINKISKLMSDRHAREEYNKINYIKSQLDIIPNYNNYFLINNVTLCKPTQLTDNDLKEYETTCTALKKDKITKININSKLDKLLALNLPNGGLPVDDFLYNDGSFEKIYKINESLLNLLKKGIVPMNEKHIYHCDIKDSNVLVYKKERILKTWLIDWGIATNYVPFEDNPFPKSWRNRPLQFNVPFSVIIFSDVFVERYTKFIQQENSLNKAELKPLNKAQLKPFVIDYINYWMKERGPGHYKFINEIMFNLFNEKLTTVSLKDRPAVVETTITMNYIVNYILEVLIYFTKFRENGTLNLRYYLDNVFIKIVDIWGFISIYIPIIELLSNNYHNLTKREITIFNQLQYIFVEYLYSPRIQPINMTLLYKDFTYLSYLIKSEQNNMKTKKKKYIKSSVSFKRKTKQQKRFKNPFFFKKI